MPTMRECDIPNAKMYAGKFKRLALSMVCCGTSKEDAMRFISSAEGITDDKKTEIGAWFRDNLPKLKDNPNYRPICEGCACCLGGKREALAREIFKTEPTLDARIRRLIASPLIVGYKGEMISDRSFYIYFAPKQDFYRCPCLGFDEGKQPFLMPESYCWCCGGHMKHHIGKALGTPVDVTFVSSSLTSMGRENCVFRVDIKE